MIGLITNPYLISNISMVLNGYEISNTFIYKILILKILHPETNLNAKIFWLNNYHNDFIYHRLIKTPYLISNISIDIKLIKIMHSFIKSHSIYQNHLRKPNLKNLFGQIIEPKVMEKNQKKQFSITLASIIWPNRSLNQVILDDSDRSNKIL